MGPGDGRDNDKQRSVHLVGLRGSLLGRRYSVLVLVRRLLVWTLLVWNWARAVIRISTICCVRLVVWAAVHTRLLLMRCRSSVLGCSCGLFRRYAAAFKCWDLGRFAEQASHTYSFLQTLLIRIFDHISVHPFSVTQIYIY